MNGLVEGMDKYKLDICALQEISCPGKGTVIKKNYMIIYSGHKKVSKMNLDRSLY